MPNTPPNLVVDQLSFDSFIAKTEAVARADGYFFEVSTDPSFQSFVPNYDGSVPSLSPSCPVTGLAPSRNYYVRVRASFHTAMSSYSQVFPVTAPVRPQTPGGSFGNPLPTPLKLDVIPPSPEAAALAKYADVPVSLYSGTPNITIPIYEVKEHNLSLPITLSYSATGNKVETPATRTGLGWSLNAGGVVTRAVRGGWPDEANMGFLKFASDYHSIDAVRRLPNNVKLGLYNLLANGCRDGEPDLFYFNFNGFSGQFMFDWDGKIKVMSGSDIKIEPIIGGERITSWTITTEDGTIYLFDAIETTALTDEPLQPTASCSLKQRLNSIGMPQSWFLTKMTSANQQHWIKFSYTGYTLATESVSNETRVFNTAFHEELNSPYVRILKTTAAGLDLVGIEVSSFPNTNRVTFARDTRPRTDVLPGSNNNFALGAIDIIDDNSRQISHWDFTYSYGGRLTLKSLTEKAGQLTKPPYLFEYSGTLPPFVDGHPSRSMDHWGFYNAADNLSLIPATDEARLGDLPFIREHLDGGDRSPNPDVVTAGMLTKITYPTGGTDTFEFESHDYSFEQDNEVIRDVVVPRTAEANAGGPGNQDVTSTFVVNVESDLHLDYAFGFPSPSEGLPQGNAPGITITDAAEKTVWTRSVAITQDDQATGSQTLFHVPAGTYKVRASSKKSRNPVNGTSTASILITWKEATGETFTDVVKGGGVRIKRITRSYGNGNPDKVTKYDYSLVENGKTKSSGSLLESAFRYEDRLTYEEPIANNAYNPVEKIVRFAQNRTALGTTQGSHVGYGQVTVLEGEHGENGKTIYRFTSPRDVTDVVSFEVPYPPSQSFDFARGLLLDQATFATAAVDTLHRVMHKYGNPPPLEVSGFKVGRLHPGPPDVPDTDKMDWFAEGAYSTTLGYTKLTETRERIMTPGQATVETIQNFVYNETTHRQLLQSTKTNSKGETFVSAFKYPLDYSLPVSAGVQKLRDLHIENVPVEQLVWKKLAGSTVNLLSGVKTDFGINSINQSPVPIAKSSAKITEPVSTTDPYSTVSSLYEPRMLLGGYDAFDNVREVSNPDGQKVSYVWGYNKRLPIAKVENASANQVFHDSFEEPGGIRVTGEKKTGKASLLLNGVYTLPVGVPSIGGNFILSYWTKGNGSGQWTYKEKLIQNYAAGTPISTDAVNGIIDEVRLYPQGALMTTYTYDPLVGMTSATDPANVTTYYEYDDFGRLKFIRDNNSDIIQNFDYQFQQEVPFPTH
jgi:YD repeat-containing protein